MKIVINKCFGGFSVSKKAVEYMAEKGSEQARAELEYIISSKDNSDCYYGYSEKIDHEYDRADPILVEAVEVLKGEANGCFSELKVVEIPDIEWEITDFNGIEVITEKNKMWS